MKKIYLLLIAVIISLTVSAQTQVLISYQSGGFNYQFQANVTDTNLIPTMTYQWNINGTILNGQTVNYTFPGLGFYYVVLTGTDTALGSIYTAYDSIYISSPCNFIGTAIVTNESMYYANDGSIDFTINGGVAPYTYSWHPTWDSTQDINNVSLGSYRVLVTDAISCSDTFVYTVHIDSINNPCNMILSANVTNESSHLAYDGSIDLTVTNGNAPFTYDWFTNNPFYGPSHGTEDRNSLTSGLYTVFVIDQDSCVATASYYVYTDSIIPIVCNIHSTYTLTYPTSASAQDGAIDITIHNANYPNFYTWYEGTNYYYTEDLNPVGSGTYTLSVVDQDSCTYTETFYLYPDTLNTIATYSYYIDTCLNQIVSASIISYTVHANNTITVVWEFVEVGTGNTSTITVTYLSNTAFLNGRYQFVLSINCNGTKSIVTDTYSDYIDIETAIDEHNTNNLYKIYPNPAKETISISLNSNTNENTNIYIYNSLGMIVYKKEIEINSGINTYQVPLINIQNGIYFININGKTQSFIKN